MGGVILRSRLARVAGVLVLAVGIGACDGATGGPEPSPPSSALPPPSTSAPTEVTVRLREYPVPAGSHPHDVAPARDGAVWYTAQTSGRLGLLDPKTGRTREIPLGRGRRRTE
jgi:streptogramin lyase